MSCTPAGRRVPAAGGRSSLERTCAAPSAARISTTSARRADPAGRLLPGRRHVQASRRRPAWTEPSGQVEAIEVHDLVPRGGEVADELLLRVVARVDLSERAELGVGAEDQ